MICRRKDHLLIICWVDLVLMFMNLKFVGLAFLGLTYIILKVEDLGLVSSEPVDLGLMN